METNKRRKTLVGVVTGTKMSKTVTVTVIRPVQHPLYKKIIKKRSKFLAHDEYERCKVGDMVKIVESRPLSRRKRWRVGEIISISPQEEKLNSSSEKEIKK
ncbi:MAG: 30S ribosomal protein S17 [Candidatus Aminicenantia bacterium]